MTDRAQSNVAGVVFAVIVVALASLIGVAIMDPLTQSSAVTDQSGEKETVALLDGTNWVDADSGVLGRGTNPRVNNSLGNAADLNESDSSVSADAGIDPKADDSWTASQVVWLDTTTANQTVLAIGAPDVIVSFRYNKTGAAETEWVAHYIGTNETYDVSINATTTQQETLVVYQNGSTLTLSDGTTSASVAIDGSHTLTYAANASGTLDGQLDETRTYNIVLSSSQRSQLESQPLYPLDVSESERGARLMYDRLGPLPQYFVGGSASTTNVTLVDGIAGERMDRADVLGNGDYRWDEDNIQIRAIDGGALDGHPVAFITYDLSSATGGVVSSFADAMNLIPVILIVLLSGTVLATIQRFR